MKSMFRGIAGALLVPIFAGCSSEAAAPVASTESKLMELRGSTFCPSRAVKRRDMARWLLRMKYGATYKPPASRGIFDDVGRGSADEPWIEQLYAEGITRGCIEGQKFCPDEDVPREQMAAFIIRLTHGADFSREGTGRFADVTGGSDIFEGYIEQLNDDGITRGCTDSNFCPRETVARDQMAAFLMRAIHPGSDPPTAGTFEDVPQSNVLGGRAEQAVNEGIMEACDSWDYTKTVSAYATGAVLHPTDNYGIVNAPQWKQFGHDHVRDQCGGEYMVHAAVDVGAVGWDSIEVKRITYFYPGNAVYATEPDALARAASNGGPSELYHNGKTRPDDNGTPFQTFEVNQTFYGVRAERQEGLVFYHWVKPAANYVPDMPGVPDMGTWAENTCGLWVKTVLQVE